MAIYFSQQTLPQIILYLEGKILNLENGLVSLNSSVKNRLERLLFTPLGSRVMLPFFGSEINETTDKALTNETLLFLRKYIFECFFDENEQLWDKELNPIEISINSEKLESLSVKIIFENGLEANFGF